MVTGMNIPLRAFSAEYATINQERWYTPQREVSFSGSQLTVFNGEDCSERTFVPFGVKEASIKAFWCMGVVHMWNMALPIGSAYGFLQMTIALSQSYRIFNLMSNAVTRIDLHNNGKQVTMHLGKVGKQQTVNISDIQKLESEKSFVETFEESSLYPIRVGTQTFYIHGPGQEAIKNGELFRAVVNGQSVKLN